MVAVVPRPLCPQPTGNGTALRLSTLWRSSRLSSEKNQPLLRKTKAVFCKEEIWSDIASLCCFRFRKGQNSDEKDEIPSPFSLNTAQHRFIRVMHNLKLPRERN